MSPSATLLMPRVSFQLAGRFLRTERSRRLTERSPRALGSTVLVSNLGRIDGARDLRALLFHPVAYGRSGVAIGAATVAGRTTVTFRGRAGEFVPQDGRALLERIAAELHGA